VVRVWEGTFGAWIKLASPLLASLRSGLHKTIMKAGDDGRVFSGYSVPVVYETSNVLDRTGWGKH
jgi:hypothetical protein